MMTGLLNRLRSRVTVIALCVLLVSLAVIGFSTLGVQAAFNNSGNIKINTQFSGNSDLFDKEARIRSYSIISNTGSSPYGEYVIYSTTQPNDSNNAVTLYYTFDYLNVRRPSGGDDYDSADICNNMNSGSGAGAMKIQLLVDFRNYERNPASPGSPDHWFNNQSTDTDNGVDSSYKLCAPSTRSVRIPAAAFRLDSVSGLWRAYFSSNLRYNYNGTGWRSTWNGDHMTAKGMRLAHIWSVSTGRYITYGDADGNGLAETTIIAGSGNGNDDNARYPFGLACNVTTATNQSAVRLFDSDNLRTGAKDVWFSVWKQDSNGNFSRLHMQRSGQYGNTIERVRIVDPFTDGWEFWGPAGTPNVKYRPGNGSGNSVYVYLNMQPHAKYYLQLFNVNSSDPNFYRIGIPTDGLYGASNFDCPAPAAVAPAATLDPSDAITNGDTFVAGATIANSNNATANVTINSREIWYDFDGSGCVAYRYESACGDVAVALPAGTQSSGNITIAANGVYDLGDTSPITANVPGGAVRVCTRFDIKGGGTTVVQTGSTTSTTGSAYACTPIAKYPALRVNNGDVRVGGNFSGSGSCTLPISTAIDSEVDGNGESILSILMHNYGASSATNGSFGSYAATAPGLIKRYGSAGFTYNNPSGLPVAGKILLFGSEGVSSYATGANGFFHVASGVGTLSNTTPTYCLPDVASNYTQPTATNLANPLQNADTSSGSRRYVFNGTNQTLNIPATALGAGQRTFIWVENNLNNANNVVRITGNITPPAANMNTTTSVPQFVLIVNDNIDLKIEGNVSSVYGVFSTRGNVYTCGNYDGSDQMSDADCSTALTVNGALITNQRVLPYRTTGNGVTYAETFNLNPGVLIGDYVRSRSNSSRFVTDYQQELPTRL